MGLNTGVQKSEGQAGEVLGWLGQAHHGIMLAVFYKVLNFKLLRVVDK